MTTTRTITIHRAIFRSFVYALTSICAFAYMQRDEETNMKIKVTSVFVDDQEKALRFYTEVLGFAKKADFSNGPFRWLTVVSPEEPDGTELKLARNNNPAAKAYQQAVFQQSQPAAMFYTNDIKGEYERSRARGA